LGGVLLDRGDVEAPIDPRPTVIFLHIGKTGGMTLRTVLNRQFPDAEVFVLRNRDRIPRNQRLRREETVQQFAALSESVRERVRLIEGHTIFGIHELVPRPSTYITLLRHPVSLTVSQYRFVVRRPRHWLHSEVTSNETSLEAYVRSGISLETDNSQTRALSGDTATPFGECSEEMLNLAKSNIDRHFSVVGLTERFDESLVLLQNVFGWSRLHYVPTNVAPREGPREPVPAATTRLIEEQNAIDMELYRWAARRFEHAVASDPSFASKLRRLRLTNTLYRPQGYLTHTLPRRLYARSKQRTRPIGTET
jgi:galactose-3-O-sulfotransferase